MTAEVGQTIKGIGKIGHRTGNTVQNKTWVTGKNRKVDGKEATHNRT